MVVGMWPALDSHLASYQGKQLDQVIAMIFGGIVSASLATLSTSQALDLVTIYLRDAREATDADIALVLCHDVERSLSQAKKAAKYSDDKQSREKIGIEYIKLGKLLHHQGRPNEAQSSYKKAEKLG
jgi:hypothetical protein